MAVRNFVNFSSLNETTDSSGNQLPSITPEDSIS